ncbi:PD-(D/E)XK nuclease family protein [Bacteroidota bacterium]
MNTFLHELAEYYVRTYLGTNEDTTIVFPNIRAGLFFRKELSSLIEKPIWPPKVSGIEDFIQQNSNFEIEDQFSLILRLYPIHKRCTGNSESFDRFYFWGRILLQDFEDIDQYLVNPQSILTTIRQLKEIDFQFSYLDEEQLSVIRKFWGAVINQKSDQKEKFIKIWEALLPIYQEFNEILKGSGVAYRGMVYRSVVERIENNDFTWHGSKMIFAGFNALSLAEEKIIKWFVNHGYGEIFWDLDAYYVGKENHEAGYFARKYSQDEVLTDTFPKDLIDRISSNKKDITLTGISSTVGQAKLCGTILKKWEQDKSMLEPEKTVIVLPDESLLMSVLQSVPDSINEINVTMGYPLRNSSLYSLLDNILELQKNARIGKKANWFYYRDVLAILNHPIVKNLDVEISGEITTKIEKWNMIRISSTMFEGSALKEMFQLVNGQDEVIRYLLDLITLIRQRMSQNEEELFEEIFMVRFYKLLQRMNDQFKHEGISLYVAEFQALFQQLTLQERVPFEGEPLIGIQVMGVLETRNLDFENVIIMSMNEGVFPSAPRRNSFLPYNVRKAFGLPNFEHQDAIFSYLFYRLLQRANRVNLLYNTTEGKGLASGEISRFLLQLNNELSKKPHEIKIASPIKPDHPEEQVVMKNDFIMKRLERYLLQNGESESKLSPSAINTYLDCPLTFFYRYVLDMKTPEEVSEDMDAAMFGNILHKVMEKAYKRFDNKTIQIDDIKEIRKHIPDLILDSFAANYGEINKENFRFEGRNIVAREIIEKYIQRILKIDEEYAPFIIRGSEKRVSFSLPINYHGEERLICMKGIIDRVDEKDGIIRVIDYKTGRDETTFNALNDLFDGTKNKRNKAVLQTLLYANVIDDQYNINNLPIQASLFNRTELMISDFNPCIKIKTGRGKSEPVIDTRLLMDEYLHQLDNVLSEIFDPTKPFKHQDPAKECVYCQYSGIAN